jgi:hypothetical protein
MNGQCRHGSFDGRQYHRPAGLEGIARRERARGFPKTGHDIETRRETLLDGGDCLSNVTRLDSIQQDASRSILI